jgi:hypothetical protein
VPDLVEALTLRHTNGRTRDHAKSNLGLMDPEILQEREDAKSFS